LYTPSFVDIWVVRVEDYGESLRDTEAHPALTGLGKFVLLLGWRSLLVTLDLHHLAGLLV
jgi:hypothetical protein